MRCKSCGYSLWNIAPGKCPECGEPFLPSEFRFRPGKVRFACTGCGQGYYGTDARGQLTPPAFDCCQCGQPCEIDRMLLAPAEGVKESDCLLGEHPWLYRSRLGWWRALRLTIWRAAVEPTSLGQDLDDSWRPGIRKAAAAFALVAISAPIAVSGVTMVALVMGLGGGGVFSSLTEMSILGAMFVIPALLAIPGLALYSLCVHLVLRMGGGTARGAAGTYAACCFGAAPMAVLAIPCVGWYCLALPMSIWATISTILQVAAVQRVTGLRASIACLLPSVGLTALGALGPFLLLGAFSPASVRLPPPPAVAPAVAPAPDASDEPETPEEPIDQ